MRLPQGLKAPAGAALQAAGAGIETWGGLSMACFMLEEAIQAYNNTATMAKREKLPDVARDALARRNRAAALGRDLAWVMNAFSPTAATGWTAYFSSPVSGGPGGTIPPETKLREDVQVGRIIDGDTFTTADGRRIRIHGINAPELGTAEGDESRRALEIYIGGATVTLVVVGDVVDLYGRLVRQVWTGPNDVGALMVNAGYAKPYEYQGIAASPEKQQRVRARPIRYG